MKKSIFLLLFFQSFSFSEEFPSDKLGEQDFPQESMVLDEDPIIYSLEKNLNFINKIISKITSQVELFNIPLEKPVIIPKWRSIPGRLSQISAGEDETVLGINAKNDIYILKKFKWLRFPGKAKSISVSDLKNVWGIGEKGGIFKFDYLKNKWIPQKGRGKYISCGFDGTVVVIHADSDAEKYHLPLGSMVILTNNKWVNFSGQLEKVTVATKIDIWGLKKSGSVWHFDGKEWSKMPGEMKSISVARDKTVVGVGLNGGAYIWGGSDWINVPGVNLIEIETLKNGSYIGLTSDGAIWSSMALNEENN